MIDTIGNNFQLWLLCSPVMVFANFFLIILVFTVRCGLQKTFNGQNGIDSSEESSSFCCSSNSKQIQDSECCPSFVTGSIPECPDGLVEATTSLCLFLTEKTKFPPKCPFPNNLPFESYYQRIEGLYGSAFWMPVQRDISNGLGYLYWVEPTTLYKSEVDPNQYPYDASKGYKNNDCLLYSNSNISLVSCDEEHPGVCVYEKLSQISDSLCSTSTVGLCRQSDFTSRTKCFCQGGTGQNQSEFVFAEFLEPYQNTVYASITADLCTIGILKENQTFIWANSRKKLDYCFWDTETNFSNSFGAMKNSGWTLTETSLSCFLYEVELEFLEPSLDLHYLEKKLELVITNPQSLKLINGEPLFFCFTNGGSFSLIYRYESVEKVQNDNTSTKYRIELHPAGPGYYWCEAFKATNNEEITSELIFVNDTSKFGAEFVVILSIQYEKDKNPLSGDFYNLLYRMLYKKLQYTSNDADCSYGSRIMKFIDIDESLNVALINLHFTCYLELAEPQSFAQSSTEEEFEKLKNLINVTITEVQETNITMKDFRSATHCLPVEENGLNWPMTGIGLHARTKQFCFTKDGLLVKRFCDGNFMDGAQWSVVDDCNVITDNSSISNDIIDHWDEPSVDLMNFLYEISLRYEEFSGVDVFLMALILNKRFDEVEESAVVPIIDNMFKVSEEVLEESQTKMRAADTLLEVIDKVKAANSSNFVTFSINLQKSCGIVVVKNEIKTLPLQVSWEKILINYNGLDAGIWLDAEPKSSDEVIFKIFLNKTLFIDTKTKNFEYVFSVTVPDSLSNTTINLLHKLENGSRESFYWKHDLTASDGRGSWVQVTNISSSFPLYILCNLQSYQSFAFAITTSFNSSAQNVTDNLEEILNSNDTASDIIDALSEISNRYSEFSANDVYLVSKILERVSNVSNLNLEPLAHTVSNLHQIQRYILATSQERKLATDGILHNIDTIIKNHNYSETVTISKDNFMILIANAQDTNFSGIVLFENEHIQTEILTGNVTITEILKKDKLNSVLIIPEDLKSEADDKIAITIFSTDGLFNEKTTSPDFVSKIFGVTFSKNKSFSKPLTFIYKVTPENYERSCSFWSYNNIEDEAGVWKKDNEGQSLSNFSQCDFEHTTHFALLLLDSLKFDNEFLGWITEINCSLSLFGLFAILFTAIFFERWRKNSGNQILLNYVLSNIVQILVFYLSSAIKEHLTNNLVCTIVGIVLHYSIIAEFCWMFVIAVLQFKRFVEVLKGPPRHVLLKGCLCGWIFPCLPVACSYFLDKNTYTQSVVGLCYPSGLGLYLGIWLPICIIVAINIVIFAYIIYSVVHKKTECSDLGNSDLMFQWRLAFLLFFMLGITWIFGFLSELDFGVVFGYVFCFSATLQGFVMFLFFIVFNANTRYLYKNALRRCCKKNY